MASVAPPTRIWDGSPHDSRTVCRRSSHVRAPPPPNIPPRLFRGGESLPQIFSRILGNSWLPVLTPRSGAHVVHFWTKNIFCSNACVVAKFEYRNAPTFFHFWGIAAFCCDRKHSRGHPSEASCGARNTENPVFPGGRGYPQARCSLYIPGVRQRRRVRVVSRKRRAEPSHMASVAPPAHIWDDSPHDSRTFRRSSSHVRAPPPKIPPRLFRGGGLLCHRYFRGFRHILGSNRRGLELLLQTVYFWRKNIFCPNGHVLESFSP